MFSSVTNLFTTLPPAPINRALDRFPMGKKICDAVQAYLESNKGGKDGNLRARKLLEDGANLTRDMLPNFLMLQILNEFKTSRQLKLELIHIFYQYSEVNDAVRVIYDAASKALQSDTPKRKHLENLIFDFFAKSPKEVSYLMEVNATLLAEEVITPVMLQLEKSQHKDFRYHILHNISNYIKSVQGRLVNDIGFKRAVALFINFMAIDPINEAACIRRELLFGLGSSIELRYILSLVYMEHALIPTSFAYKVCKEINSYITDPTKRSPVTGSEGIDRAKLLLRVYLDKDDDRAKERLEYDIIKGLGSSTQLRLNLTALYLKEFKQLPPVFNLVGHLRARIEDYLVANPAMTIGRTEAVRLRSLIDKNAKDCDTAITRVDSADKMRLKTIVQEFNEKLAIKIADYVVYSGSDMTLQVALGYTIAAHLGISDEKLKQHMVTSTGMAIPPYIGIKTAIAEALALKNTIQEQTQGYELFAVCSEQNPSELSTSPTTSESESTLSTSSFSIMSHNLSAFADDEEYKNPFAITKKK